jgi:hypothetical protein
MAPLGQAWMQMVQPSRHLLDSKPNGFVACQAPVGQTGMQTAL